MAVPINHRDVMQRRQHNLLVMALKLSPINCFKHNGLRYHAQTCPETFWLTTVDVAQWSQPCWWHVWSCRDGRHDPSSIFGLSSTRNQPNASTYLANFASTLFLNPLDTIPVTMLAIWPGFSRFGRFYAMLIGIQKLSTPGTCWYKCSV